MTRVKRALAAFVTMTASLIVPTVAMAAGNATTPTTVNTPKSQPLLHTYDYGLLAVAVLLVVFLIWHMRQRRNQGF